MTPEELWKKSGLNGTYGIFEYGSDDPEELMRLTLKKIKQATTGALRLYEMDHEPVPQEGEYYVIRDSAGNARCVIRDTRIIICPFREVTEEMAAIEGEGDRSLQYWRDAHLNFFGREYAEQGLVFTEEELVVFEQFEVVYPSEIDL
ncbi:MAG: ASCH domain-containing protein [Solobacterium sp.]|jgi:uncharacterized protein YhfF|nr:ASCH domain-containing protein [Solobacterium sp.]MCH4222677.1 ASCH domain-containing protein [Solobacterium sp.]MCH4265801.1 ASCH domain-containing protein [Solobacterium sp.]